MYTTALGRVATYYYITFNALATVHQHPKPTLGDNALLRVFMYNI